MMTTQFKVLPPSPWERLLHHINSSWLVCTVRFSIMKNSNQVTNKAYIDCSVYERYDTDSGDAVGFRPL